MPPSEAVPAPYRSGRTSFSTTVVLVFAVLYAAQPVAAVSFQQADRYILDAGERVDEELWIRAGQLTINGDMGNQVFALATNLVFNGSFQDDVWAASSGSAVFNGRAGNHLRLGATESIRIGGSVADSVTLAASTVKLDPEAVLEGDALLAGEDVLTEARIDGSVRMIASRATLGGRIGGSVHILAEDIVVLPDTVIEGDLVYTMSKDLVLSSRVQLNGTLRRAGVEDLLPESRPRSLLQAVLIQAFFFVNAFLSGMVLLMFMPRFLAHAAARIRLSLARCMLTGSLVFILMPFILQSLLLNKTTLILGGMGSMLYVAGLYLAKTVPALLLGGLMMRLRGPQPLPRMILTLLAGMAALYALMAAPLLGALLWVTASCLGLGSMLVAMWDTQVRPTVPPPTPDTASLAPQRKSGHSKK